MSSTVIHSEVKTSKPHSPHKASVKAWLGTALTLGVFGAGIVFGPQLLSPAATAAAPAAPTVTVSAPAQRSIARQLQFLGQFSAVQQVELRPQVGGTLTRIAFRDGDIVHQGDVLFEIDPTPYQIRFSQATAQLETARAQLELANQQLDRADTLKDKGFGTVELSDQRLAAKRAAQASVDSAEAAVRDAKFDLDHTRMIAPFTGRIGTHLVSTGNLVAGSRAATSPTTLLATLVSVDTIYLNFDMSESDYATFQQERRQQQQGPLADKVEVSLNNGSFDHEGTLDFIDNVLDRSSGTIHARATLDNSQGTLTPGAFARVRVAVSKPAMALLVPDASVLSDQTDHIVMTVADGVVTPKKVELGDIRDGLRVVRSGLTSSDKVIVSGIPLVRPGAKVTTQASKLALAAN